jgi:hypothetical protein
MQRPICSIESDPTHAGINLDESVSSILNVAATVPAVGLVPGPVARAEDLETVGVVSIIHRLRLQRELETMIRQQQVVAIRQVSLLPNPPGSKDYWRPARKPIGCKPALALIPASHPLQYGS